jgi:hypothetical protein
MPVGEPVRGGEGFFAKLLLVPVDQVGRNEAGLALRGFSVSGVLREGNLRSRSLGGGGLPRPESKRRNTVRHENGSPSGVAGPWQAVPQSVREMLLGVQAVNATPRFGVQVFYRA